MNAKKLLFRAFLVCTALIAVSCAPAKGPGLGGAIAGSKVIKTETRHTGAFQAIVLEYPADVTLQQGAEDVVWIQADDNLLTQISTEVASGRLTIKTLETEWKARVNASQPVKIAITAQNPNEIVLSGPAGTLEVNDLKAGTLKLVLSGAGQIRVTGLQAEVLDTVLSGAGDIQVGGAAEEIKVLLSGWGNFNAADLNSNKATVDLSGAGDVVVRVEKELVAMIKGTGSVKYFGNPHIAQTVTGAGSIKRAE
jgi:hypothetical protein